MVNQNKNFALAGINGSLCITANEQGWSQVVLHHEGLDHPLGAEDFKYIATNIMKFLAIDKTEQLKWVLSLSELHYSVYGTSNDAGTTLKIQDSNAKWVANIKLNSQQKKEWIDIIQSKIGLMN